MKIGVDLVNYMFYSIVDQVNSRGNKMKSSTKRMVEVFPKFKGRLKAYENIDLVEEALKGLTEVEATFLKLAWFFEAPEYESFNIDGCMNL
jgi:hypothetical protein